MAASYPTKIILAFRSGGVCAFPECGKHLTYDAKEGEDTYVAEAAHIRGEEPGAARYDPSMSDAERDNVRNLIYLCTDHHTIIDKVEADWPTSKGSTKNLGVNAWRRRRFRDPPSKMMVLRRGLKQILLGGAVD